MRPNVVLTAHFLINVRVINQLVARMEVWHPQHLLLLINNTAALHADIAATRLMSNSPLLGVIELTFSRLVGRRLASILGRGPGSLRCKSFAVVINRHLLERVGRVALTRLRLGKTVNFSDRCGLRIVQRARQRRHSHRSVR